MLFFGFCYVLGVYKYKLLINPLEGRDSHTKIYREIQQHGGTHERVSVCMCVCMGMRLCE